MTGRVALGVAGVGVTAFVTLLLVLAGHGDTGPARGILTRGPARSVEGGQADGRLIGDPVAHNRDAAAEAKGLCPPEGQAAEHQEGAGEWEKMLLRQRVMREKLKAVKVVKAGGVWLEDTSVGERVRALEADAGVPITWDPTVAHLAATTSPGAEWGTANILDVARYLAGVKGMSLRVTNEGLRFVPLVSPTDPVNIAQYEEDPLAAFTAARYLAEQDRRFYRRWRSIEECEETQVEIDAGAEFTTVYDALTAILRSAGSPAGGAYGWNPAAEPAGSGIRRGALRVVMQSWCPGATVVTGRDSIQVWRDGSRAAASATDKREYEEFRFRLAETPWRPSAAESGLREVAAAVTESTGVKALVDPEVAGMRMRVAPDASLLDILEQGAGRDRSGFTWTWILGVFVITGAQ